MGAVDLVAAVHVASAEEGLDPAPQVLRLARRRRRQPGGSGSAAAGGVREETDRETGREERGG